MKNNKLKNIIILVESILLIVCIVFIIILNIKLNNNDDSIDETNDISSSETLTPDYNGELISDNGNWIGYYKNGELKICVYNKKNNGGYNQNRNYICSDGVTCCTGDETQEYEYTGGSALGGGMISSANN